MTKKAKSGGQKKSNPFGLTNKQKAFADKLIEDPKKSAPQAVRETYNVGSRGGDLINSAGQTAHKLLKNTKVQAYLEAKSVDASEVMVDLLNSDKEEYRFRSAKDILDRTVGKAPDKHLHAHIKTVNVINYSDKPIEELAQQSQES